MPAYWCPAARRDDDLTRRRDEHVGAVPHAARIIGVGQHVEGREVLVVEELRELLSAAVQVPRHERAGVVGQRLVDA